MAIDQFKTVDIVVTNINEDYIPQQSAVQGERSGRSLTLQITNGGKVENQIGVSVNLGWSHDTAKNSEGEKLQGLDAFEVIDRSKGLYRFDYPSNMMQPGQVTSVIQIIGPSSDTRSKPFKIKVEKAPFDDEAVESDNSFSALQSALTSAVKYDGEIQNLKENKADLGYVDEKLGTIVSGSPKETFNTLKELNAKYPSGAEGIYVVVDDGQWYYWNAASSKWISGGKYSAGDSTDVYFPATNIIPNGDFSNGLVGYSMYGGTGKIEANTLKILGNGTLGAVGTYTSNESSLVVSSNDLLYFKVRIRVTNDQCKYIRIYLSNGSNTVDVGSTEELIPKPLKNTWYDISETVTIPDILTGENVKVFILAYYSDKTVANGMQTEIWRPLGINLTKTFGKGLEPKTKEVENYLSQHSHRWFPGQNLRFVSAKRLYADILTRNESKKEDKEDGVVVDDFDSSEWITNTSGVTLEKVNDKVIVGKKSLQVDAQAISNQTIVLDRGTEIEWNTSMKEKMMLRVWIEDVSKISNLTLYLGNDALIWGNYCRFKFLGGGEAGTRLKNGWNFLAIVPSETIITNSFSFSKAIKKMRITILPKENASVRVILDSIVDKITSTPKIVMTFDDGWKTVYDNAFKIMRDRGLRGTIYAIGQYTDNPNNPLSPFFMSVAEFQEMYREKWHIGNHTWQHNYYFGGNHTPTSYLDTLIKNRNFLIDNDLGEGGNYVCYPNGEYDQRVINLMKVNNFKSARAAKIRGNHPELIDDEFQLLSEAFGYTTTIEESKKWIDRCLEVGGTFFLQFHSIPLDDTIHGPNDPSVGYQNKYISWSLDKFTQLMDYIVSKGLADNCMTHEEWYNDLSKKI